MYPNPDTNASAPPPQPAPSAPATSVQAQKSEGAKVFLDRARELLTRSEYETFKSLLIDFRKPSGDSQQSKAAAQKFEELTKRIKTMFSGERAELLKGFEQFIPERRRERYRQLISEEDAEMSESNPTKSGTNGKLAERKNLSQETPNNKRKRVVDLLTGSSSVKKTRLPGYNSDATPSAPPAPIPAPPPVIDISLTLEENNVSGITSDAPTVGKTPVCTVCQEPYRDPHVARVCGHMCCLECWENWLKMKLECPMCKAKVRPKLLTRVFL
jgi:hypothetical protein